MSGGAVPAARRTLLELFLGSVVAEVPHSRLATALKEADDGTWSGWLTQAAGVLGWESDEVQAPFRAVSGDRDAWWITCATEDRERWLVLTGQRGEEARASVIDGQTARDVPFEAETLAKVLGVADVREPLTWIRLMPTPPLEPLRTAPGDSPILPLKRLGKWTRLEGSAVWAVVAYSAVIGAISLALPLAVQSLVNSLALGQLIQPLVIISLGLLGLLGLAAGLRVLEVYIVELLQRRMFSDVARDVARRLPGALREAGGKWGLTERINRFFDVVGAQKAASSLLLSGTEVVMSSVAGLTVLAFYHPYMLIFDIVLIVTLSVIIFWMGRGGIGTAIEESTAKYELAAWLESIARRQSRFASPEGAAWAARQTDRRTVDWLKRRSAHFAIVFRQTIGFAAVQATASAGLLGLGGFLVWNNQLTLGQLVASELIITSVLAQLAKFGKHVESFYDLNASVHKLGSLLDLETEPATGELIEDLEEGLEVRLEDARTEHFRFDLVARPGERVGLEAMGDRSRDALYDLIYGMRVPDEGKVLLDGASGAALAPRARRAQIARLYRGLPVGATLEENLTSQDARVTVSDLRDVIRTVGLSSLLEELPDGLQTWVHPDGYPLEGNQLVALEAARCLVRNPRLLLVDDVLDRLRGDLHDPVWKALSRRDARWTLIVASGRRDVLSQCDRIYRWTGHEMREVLQ